jgi:hypothetical protein
VDIVTAVADEPFAATALLVRPDGCTAWSADGRGREAKNLRASLARWFGPAR